MANATSYSASGTKSSAKATLDKAVFGLEVKSHGLLRDAYKTYLDNGRINLARTKTRGEVVGSTKKPWKQKGTGRARFGSRYNPIWRGGGITFGPTGEENYSKKLNLKAKRLAIKQALSLSAQEDKIKLIDKFEAKDGKTKNAAALLKKIGTGKKTLLVVDHKEENLTKATGNIPALKLVNAKYLNVFDILNADTVIITKKSLEVISEWLAEKTAKLSKAEAEK
jgi:large subunit ribosomal protein L4